MKFLRNIYQSFIDARQKQANFEIAKQLHWGEFRHETFEYVLHAVQNGKVHELLKQKRV